MIVLEEMPYRLKNTAICIGKFDGMHCGHRLLTDSIRACRDKTKVLFTFSIPNTKSIYAPEEKRYLAEQLGMDVYIDCPFDERLSRMNPEEFLENILIRQCGAAVISVGEDFRFGYERRGDVRLLRSYQKIYGYELNIFPKKEMFGEVVSSTGIRKHLREGNLKMVNELLGEPYFLYGTVCHGNQIGGKALHMPTANQLPGDDKILPPFGVYASRIKWNGGSYEGVTNIGIKPTIPGENQAGAETYIMDFDSMLYGEKICVELCAFLRGERRFSDLEALRNQMEEDKRNAALFFGRDLG